MVDTILIFLILSLLNTTFEYILYSIYNMKKLLILISIVLDLIVLDVVITKTVLTNERSSRESLSLKFGQGD